MKKIVLLYSVIFSTCSLADNACFVTKQNNEIIKNSQTCNNQHPPSSTFKIPLSLIAKQEGIIVNEVSPILDYDEDFVDWIGYWRSASNASNFEENSCSLYMKSIVQRVGADKLQAYIDSFDYGNKDLSAIKTNSSQECKITQSLQISPIEQVEFLQKLINNKLPISLDAKKLTQELLYIDTLKDDWKLYGQAATGYRRVPPQKEQNEQKEQKGVLSSIFSWFFDFKKHHNIPVSYGWFVGWIEKDGTKIPFAYYSDKKNAMLAVEEGRKELISLINQQQSTTKNTHDSQATSR
jgi:beta-lactamase class D